MDENDIGDGITLRAEQAGDAAFVDALTRGQLVEGLGGLMDGPLLEMQLRSRAATLAHRFPDLRREVARVGDNPVGSLLTAALDGTLHVVEIMIVPAWRRRGLARQMLEAVIRRATADARDVTAMIYVSNTASLRLFSACGFGLERADGEAQTTARLRTLRN